MEARRIVLAVTGGIAAYKTPELVRRLRERGADVQIVMTASAAEEIPKLKSWRVVSDFAVATTPRSSSSKTASV